MTGKNTTKRRVVALIAIMVATSPLVLLASSPAAAQFFPFWGPQQQQPSYQERYREPPPADYSKAPPAKKAEVPPTSSVVVMGDSMADWLAYGLEEAFADTPEIGVTRKNKPNSGLIRYESKSDLEWSSVARDIITTERPAVAVMILGLSDRGPIRERLAVKPAPAPAPAPAQPETAAKPPDQQTADAESADAPIIAPEVSRGRGSSHEYRTEAWAEIYSKRIAETIAAMKSRGVPAIWVGLPIIRGPKATSDAAYLNDIYRAQAEKAGIIYVDVWDGFVDEAGKFASFGPDVDGQTRRLRSQDGVYFTKYGARKLAHFVEREIRRVISTRALPVALPVDGGAQPSGAPRPGGPIARPIAGAVLPLTSGTASGGDELLGGGNMRPSASDPIASRVLVKGEPVSALKGRADDFVWPLGGGGTLPVANTIQEPGTIKPAEVPVVATGAQTSPKPKTDVQVLNQPPRRPRPPQPSPPPPQQWQRSPFSSPFSFFR
ncbi:MAG: uncharacterized protein QOD94_1610 [Alphaproteobacteria bacterium]|nr:uncharacterized protein [Alphaproteobacteria bacterium]